jgi:hypothetical protein
VSDIISVKKDKNNNVVEGNPDRIKTVTDECMLNRKRANISGSLKSAKRKINQISKFTGTRAEIKANGNKQNFG